MAEDQDRHASPAEALDRLGRLSLRELSLDGLLQVVADLAKEVMPGNPEASVTLVTRERPSTVVTTGRLATDLDETQYDLDQGPCLNAARTGELTEIVDTRAERRWPVYGRRAAEHGNLSSLSVPLAIDQNEGITGALNLYAREPAAFDESSRAAALAFGPYAAVAAGNLYAYQSARDMAHNLQTALESRAVIDQAKGVLIERHKITPDQAFQLLAQVSMNANRKVRDVAEELVLTGALPVAPQRGEPRRTRHTPRGRRLPGAPEHS